jgi:neutral ceramidase
MGFSFAAGTTDGPGAFDFTQSDTNGTMFWKLVRDFITKPTKEQEECHKPKPILLDVGKADTASFHLPIERNDKLTEKRIEMQVKCITLMNGHHTL